MNNSDINKKKDELFKELESIGFRVSSTHPALNEIPDIERTLIKSLYYIDIEGRFLGLIFSWLQIHGAHLNADKFFKEYSEAKKYLGETPWFSGVCSYMYAQKDHRFKKGIKKIHKPHSLGNKDQSSLIKLKGSVDFLEEVGIMAPTSALRIRQQDVMSSDELIKTNIQYRNRFIYGSNWRSEIITTIQNGAQNPNQVSKILGLARSRVGIVFKEYMLIKDFI